MPTKTKQAPAKPVIAPTTDPEALFIGEIGARLGVAELVNWKAQWRKLWYRSPDEAKARLEQLVSALEARTDADFERRFEPVEPRLPTTSQLRQAREHPSERTPACTTIEVREDTWDHFRDVSDKLGLPPGPFLQIVLCAIIDLAEGDDFDFHLPLMLKQVSND